MIQSIEKPARFEGTYPKSLKPVLIKASIYRVLYFDIRGIRYAWLWQAGRFFKTFCNIGGNTPKGA